MSYGNADPGFWENIPDHFDTSGGVLHDTRYDRSDMTEARIIHEDAVRERSERRIRAGMTLADDIRDANRRYAEEMTEADRMYKLRIENHPLPEGFMQ